MSKRTIKKVAVLGSGVMGSRIACHFAGVGLQVLLLDIQPKDLPADAKTADKNKIVIILSRSQDSGDDGGKAFGDLIKGLSSLKSLTFDLS